MLEFECLCTALQSRVWKEFTTKEFFSVKRRWNSSVEERSTEGERDAEVESSERESGAVWR